MTPSESPKRKDPPPMAEDLIRYDVLAQEALRGVVRKVLVEVGKTGLPGDHHFFISFLTRAPGVKISDRLLGQYDKEMTIVLQNQFWDLKVGDTGFEVGLSFDGQPESLYVPFATIKGFFDPSVQFGLQFDVEQDIASELVDDGRADANAPVPLPETGGKAADGAASPDDSTTPGEKVVSLDSFRKKP
jgi:hypothetical protein